MAYAQIHVGAPRHPKIFMLSHEAHRLWINGLCYCQEHLTDGIILTAVLPLLDARVATSENIADLVGARLWEPMPGEHGFIVHDYFDWNDSRDMIQKRKEDARIRAETSRAKRRERAERKVRALRAREVRRTSRAPNAHGAEPRRNETRRDETQKDQNQEPGGQAARFGPRDLQALWNAQSPPLTRCLEITSARQKSATARLREHPLADYWAEVIAKIAASPFCVGRNDRQWRATFDWLLQPDTGARVLEGKYAGRTEQRDRSGLIAVRDEWICPHEEDGGEHCLSRRGCDQLVAMAAVRKESA